MLYFLNWLLACVPCLCVHRCLCKLQTKAGDSLTSFLVFCSSTCKNWTNDMMFSGIMHSVAVCEHSAPQPRELSWPLVMWSVSEQRTPARINLCTRGCTTQDSGWLLEQPILLKMWQRSKKNHYSSLLLFLIQNPWRTGLAHLPVRKEYSKPKEAYRFSSFFNKNRSCMAHFS